MRLAEPVYSVLEGDSAEICFHLLGVLERDVIVMLATQTLESDNARSMSNYIYSKIHLIQVLLD